MDLDNYNFQSHVAQQSRRNKLRVQSTEHIEDYSSNLDHLNPNHAQIPNMRYGLSYDPSLISSEMHNFATNNSQLLSAHKDTARVWVGDYLGNQNAYSIGEGSMSVTKAYDSPSSLYQEPSFDGYRGSNNSNFTNISGKISIQNSQKMHEEMHYNPSIMYQNALPITIVSSADTNSTDGLELAPIINQTNIHHWSRDLNSSIASDSVKQGLSLSLSPDGIVYPAGNLNSTSKQSVVANCNIIGNVGPLGPFTGYAAILKNSKFLGPAQQLLGDMCIINSSILARTSDALKYKISNEERNFGASANFVDQSKISSPRVYGSNENGGDVVRTRLFESFRPEYQQKKEKLLYMQEEVSRRQKQYNKQMELVVSSFESVSGLSEATPYISLALKTISKNFRSLKNVISEQLKNMCKSLDDANTSIRGDTSSSRLKFVDQISGGCNLGISAPQPPQANWRTQRGLPERSVAVLRAWLFEHFLHPYPTDTDKHMLASQTGLTRDQVSNWFINARVRVWKPMVEEIHALETKNINDAISNSNQESISTNLPAKPSDLYATSSNKVSSLQHYGDQWDHTMEKRSRTEYQVLDCMGADTSFMGFMPNQRSGNDGLNPVSLTLGLRQSPEGMRPQQQQQQQHDHVQQSRGQMVHHDFVG